MLFNSEQYLIFLPIVVLIYFIIPSRVRYIWLLISSYFFYMCWNAQYAILILTSTVITYASGLIIHNIKGKVIKKWTVAICAAINLGILFYFKYINFGIYLLQKAFSVIHVTINIPAFDVILPVGISFYTFQVLSYTIDVYREEIYPEKNFLKYALFVSFFPQLVAGPIERSKNLLKQLDIPHKFSVDNFIDGIMLMTWGYFLKIVISDRVAIFVDTVYGNYQTYYGWYIIVATVLFAFQIYCDFYGYSVIAKGTAKILDIDLMENFDAPYNARTVGEFWRRWHISLTTWFKDYIYIPLGGNRKGKLRGNINKLIVFLISGLWHGANLSFVVWGGINGLYQIIGDYLRPLREKLISVFKLDKNAYSHRFAQIIVTFLLVDFSWIFFRAAGLRVALEMIKYIFKEANTWILFDDSLFNCGLDRKNFSIMIISIIILMIADALKYRNIVIREFIRKQEAWFVCVAMAFSIWIVLILGIWGPSYNAANFIYFQF